MDTNKIMKMPSCGGCMSKLPPGMLREAVANIPTFSDPNLLVGFDTSDDGAVYRFGGDLALIQTLDFFAPMVDDPYLFGKIAAANALSDVYAMGGKVVSALNIVCFPEDDDPAVLAAILRGGAEKVKEAGGVLCGGHSISGETKYGLSVVGTVHPDKIMRNNTCRIGDVIILTKPLGVGMVTASYRFNEIGEDDFLAATSSMQTLNRYAFEIAEKFDISAVTDVTGFGFLGHLDEMVAGNYSIVVDSKGIKYIPGAMRLAEELLITGGGQKNRNFLRDKVEFCGVNNAMQEILFDPQTSGGLLLSVSAKDAPALLRKLGGLELPSCIVGEVVPRKSKNIIVKQ